VEWERILNDREAALSERERILARKEALVPETVEVKENICPKCGGVIPGGSDVCPACAAAEAEAKMAAEEAARKAAEEEARKVAEEEARKAAEAAQAKAAAEAIPVPAPEPAPVAAEQPAAAAAVEVGVQPQQVEAPKAEEPVQEAVAVENFCPNCRTIVDVNAEKCYACGADLRGATVEAKEGEAPAEEKPSEEAQKGPEVKRSVSIRRIIRRK